MKRLYFNYFCFFLLLSFTLHAQDAVQISGTVTSSEDGNPIPGVSVIVKGTNSGSATDMEGNYTLEVSSDATLVFSSVGMATVEVPVEGQSVINVILQPDVIGLEEVVVTALGIRRNEKALGYSVTQVSGDEITKTSNRSPMNALQGKVAGVNISTSSTQPGASTRVIMRGFSSIEGNNQPLYVIDGIPINNSSRGLNDDLNGGVDFGNRANDINPDDIESMSFLKGSAATALYGSRAANGVILITTKKGQTVERASVTLSSSVSFDSPLRIPKFQNEYGQGFFGAPDLLENTSWGPKLDGEERVWGHIVGNSQKLKTYKALPSNVRDFFDVGKTYNSSASISGGTEKATYRLSLSNITSDGIFPTDADSYEKNTIMMSGSTRFTEKLSAESSIQYINKTTSSVPTGQQASTYNNIMQTPRDISIVDLEDYKDPFNNLDNYYSPYTQNPYYALNEHGNELIDDRIIGNINLNYNISKSITATYRIGTDVGNARLKEWRAITFPSPGSYNEGVDTEAGRVRAASFSDSQINSDFMVSFNNKFNDFDFNLMLGHNYNYRSSRSTYTQVIGLDIPFFYDLSNSSASPTTSTDDYFIGTQRQRLVGLYANLDLAFRDFLFLTGTFRTDWASTLPEENKNYSYPGVNLGFVFTELMPDIEDVLTFGKIRVGWGRTGREAPPYLTRSVFVQGNMDDGFRELTFPLAGGINGFEVSNIIGNEELTHELTEEIEIGTDLRFFTNRLRIDFTYYNRSITNLIYPVDISFTTGFRNLVSNIGEITNKGVEVLLGIVPVRTRNFTWDITFNFTKNENELVELTQGLEKVPLGGLAALSLVAVPGEPMGLIEGDAPLRDSQGRIVVGSNGLPIPSTEKFIYGDVNYDWIGGVSTTLSFKGISLGATVDVRQGGVMYSRTADIMYFAGIAPQTVFNDRQPFIIPNSVMQIAEDAEGNPIYGENNIPITNGNLYTYWGEGGTELDGAFILDKSFVKLREVSLVYTIPPKVFKNGFIRGLDIGVIGRNLLLWTPEDQTFIDPEVSTFDDGLGLLAEFGEFSAAPTTRSFGFNFRIIF